MQTIKHPECFRKNVLAKLQDILATSTLPSTLNIGINIEKGIFNYAIKEADKHDIVKKWDNPYFTQIYIDKLRTVITNLEKNENLRQNVLSKTIKAQDIAFMSHQLMEPEKWAKRIEDKKIRDENRYAPKIEASTDNFTCRKCKSKKCSYYQLQTRSADEPMTTFVNCISCGSRWKC